VRWCSILPLASLVTNNLQRYSGERLRAALALAYGL
jgi:hypothetical protein